MAVLIVISKPPHGHILAAKHHLPQRRFFYYRRVALLCNLHYLCRIDSVFSRSKALFGTIANHLTRYFLILYQVNIGFESSHIIPKCVNDIFFFYLANGIQHCNEHHKEHTEHADSDTGPRQHKIDTIRSADEHSFVDQPG